MVHRVMEGCRDGITDSDFRLGKTSAEHPEFSAAQFSETAVTSGSALKPSLLKLQSLGWRKSYGCS